MDMRVEQLAERCDLPIDTIRYYQGKGLLSPPRRSGRHALYGPEHLERIARIRSLQARGLTLAVIKRLVTGELDDADAELAAAVANDSGDASPSRVQFLTLAEVAGRSGIPLPLLQAIQAEGLLLPRRVGQEDRYTLEDVEIAGAGLVLLEAGLPLPEVLALARRHHAETRRVAAEAVELFDRHIRQPLQARGLPNAEAAALLVEAFNTLLPATTAIVAHHFRRTLLAVAQEHIERVGDDAERDAVRAAAAQTA